MEAHLLYVYEAWRDNKLVGTAYFDAHKVRTLQEVLMFAVDDKDRIARVEIRPRSALPLQLANNKPMAAPALASSTLSVNNCRIKRTRPAPTARRIAISFHRAAALASSRFAMLAQAISSASAATTISIASDRPYRERKSDLLNQSSLTATPCPARSAAVAKPAR